MRRLSIAAAVLVTSTLGVPHISNACCGGGEFRIFYHKKNSDPATLPGALQVVADRLSANLIQVVGSGFYDEKNLGSNALLCGEKVDLNEFREVFRELLSQNIRIQYVGKYYEPEINSKRNSIDIRSINGERYFENMKPLNETDLNHAISKVGVDNFCGFGDGFDVVKADADVIKNRNVRYLIKNIGTRSEAEDYEHVYKQEGLLVEITEELDGTFSISIK